MKSLIWQDNKAILTWKRRLLGVSSLGSRTLDFDVYNLKRGGLLEEALSECSYPLGYALANQTVRMVTQHVEHSSVIEILNTPSSLLSPIQITALYEIFETTILNTPTISKETKNAVSGQYRRIISSCSKTLINGDKVSSVKFCSQFVSHTSAEGRLLASKKKSRKSLIDEDSLQSIKHNNHEELRSNFSKIVKNDLNDIESACWDIVDRYIKLKEHHSNLIRRCDQVSNEISTETIIDYSLGRKLIKLVDSKYYTIEGYRNLFLEDKSFGHSSGLIHYHKKSWNTFDDDFKYIHSIKDFFYTSYYVPSIVLLSSKCLLLIFSGWNIDTISSVTLNNIILNKKYIIISSVKNKTNTTESIKIHKSENFKLYNLIILIVKHNKNVDKYWSRSSNNIWVSMPRKTNSDLYFSSSKEYSNLSHIIKYYGLKKFSLKQLRDQVATLDYLNYIDPFRVKEMLGHKNIETTLSYLNHVIIRLLNKSNIKRFMDRLAATIIWTISEKEKTSIKELKLNNVDSQLLFPLLNNKKNEKSVCDMWINSMGSLEFNIGKNEIDHLNWQIEYYSKYSQSLRQENPKSFLIYHVPRILFCTALAEIVRNSPYRSFLK